MDDNFDNHLEFLNGHRGTVRRTAELVSLEGAAPFLSFHSPCSDSAQIPDTASALWCFPWSGPNWGSRLEAMGYAPAEQLAYMELAQEIDRPRAANCQVTVVRDEKAARAFASVQSRGFLSDESPHRDWWAARFEAMAIRHYRSPRQTFYLAWVADRPAAVLLAVRTKGVTGIYAVATDPGYRKAGLSSLLLHVAYQDALALGAGRLVLQAVADQYARAFYERSGFVEQYRNQVWRRT